MIYLIILIGLAAGNVLLWQTLRFLERQSQLPRGLFSGLRHRWPRLFRIYMIGGWAGLALTVIFTLFLALGFLGVSNP
jgi:hypothetical protein